jgi:type IV pilus assembly protein PilB
MLNSDLLFKIILSSKLFSKEELKEAERQAKKRKIKLEKYLLEKKLISEELLYKTAANYFNLPFLDLEDRLIAPDILFLISEPIAQTHGVIAFAKEAEKLKLATLDPEDLEIFEFIKKKTNLEVEVYLTTPSSLSNALKQYRKGLKMEFKELEEKPIGKIREEKNLEELSQRLPVVRIVNTLLEYAIFEGASDIHIEPEEKNIIVRYRIDGILREVMTLPKTIQAGIIARIKVLSNLKLDEHRLPQDGRFKMATAFYKVSFRVSIIPVFDGEKVVMRLLMESGEMLSLEQLGFRPKPLEIVKRNIKKPHGMILVTGPTGSGKTTTLYSVLAILNKPEVNITTIEDPIEYRMPHINQSQVSSKIGFTFANGLRSLLRQDPDIIMVGEIRDSETAGIAVNAAMTGHLVLSTLHTNDTVTALPRLLDMGILPFLIASTTNLIMAQRLVRKICSHCKTSYNLDKQAFEELEKQFDLKTLLNTLIQEKIVSKEQDFRSLLFYRGKGCKRCNNEGYKGRIGIYEILEVTKEIGELIMVRATADQLKEGAKKQKMTTMLEDGFMKVVSGITTIEEVLRVTKE